MKFAESPTKRTSVAIRVKLIELEALDDGTSRIAFTDDAEHSRARALAALLFEDVEIRVRRAT